MLKGITTAGLLLLGSSAMAQASMSGPVLLANCQTFAQTLVNASANSVIRLSGDCGLIRIRGRTSPVTVIAGNPQDPRATPRATVRGLWIENSANITWIGGNLQAEEGLRPSTPTKGYGAAIRRSENIEVRGAHFTHAVRGITINNSRQIRVRHSIFEHLVSDGINFVDGDGLLVEGNLMQDFMPVPTRCTFADGSVIEEISERACVSQGGSWRDGSHPDGFQTWGTSSNILVRDNRIFTPWPGDAQGITTAGATSVANVRFVNNEVTTDMPTAIAISQCFGGGCEIIGNTVAQATDHARHTVRIIVRDGTARACGNTVLNSRSTFGTEPC